MMAGQASQGRTGLSALQAQTLPRTSKKHDNGTARPGRSDGINVLWVT